MSKRIVLLLAACTAAIATLPNLYGLMKTPQGTLYLWSGPAWDINTYLILMRVGYDGALLQTNLLTSEPHPPVLSLPFYILLGHVARWYGALWASVSGEPIPSWRVIPIAFQHARTILTFLLVLAIYGMTTQLATRRHRRLWIVAYSVFGAGTILGHNTILTEGSVIASCVTYPHFVAALIAYMGAVASLIMGLRSDESARDARERKRKVWAYVLAFLGGLGLGWIHPFDLPPLFVAGAAVLVVRRFQTGRWPRAYLKILLVFCAVSGLSVLYQMSIMWRLPDFRQIDSNNVLYWWTRWSSLEAMDGLLYLSIPGLGLLLLRRRRPEAVFLVVWVAAIVVTMHAPVKFQRRLIEGLPIAFSCILPWTVEAILIRPLRRRGPRPRNVRARIRLVRHATYLAVLLLLLPRTFYILYDRSFNAFSLLSDSHYVDMREVEAADWLSHHAPPDSVVWASKRRGNRLPFFTGLRVYYGHDIMTVYSERKEHETNCLFNYVLPVEDFRRIVREYGIDYVFWTAFDPTYPDGEHMGDYDPETLGEPVFDSQFARIYAVSKRSREAAALR
ncbi:hypothetical protein JW916_16775 [Candidatus Sumerlaeota bacterium]|nr:hypothetical protein [Candidatus Sumerlaeota bacterium]